MAAGDIHAGDSGIVFQSTILDENNQVIDMSLANLIQFEFEKPDKTMLIAPANLSTDGKDGKVEYTIGSGDLDQVGKYKYQVYFEVGSSRKHTDVTSFKVLANLPT
jgi:hypothetical protein